MVRAAVGRRAGTATAAKAAEGLGKGRQRNLWEHPAPFCELRFIHIKIPLLPCGGNAFILGALGRLFPYLTAEGALHCT